ncbi:efflux RND transporter periplasmic adaptor subunit [Pseudomonas jilinensis]|uniref:Efflux transporter periplasmic adaptor subunit n=1 Tax=Pseudomonas jilinensis TaxID=2078689 RepID=A0A396RXT5_9PSED|nr:efflux RND transporter periplasmic adaptor subunit [Pseudomonas jilinensis]RHW21434.1 efflux transporter periplasmic adaptor subunit [Pseudomonas jilinensis]
MKHSKRRLILAGVGVALLLALGLGFRSPAILVETAEVQQGPFRVSIEEEGRTRLADRYEVSAAVAGHLNRIELEPGDRLEPGDTLFTINPSASIPLDSRSRSQAEAALASAEAALLAAHSLVDSEQARLQLAETELSRIRRLVNAGHVAVDALDRAETEQRQADAALRSARFAADVARHERDNAQAVLAVTSGQPGSEALIVRSPLSATVLRRLRQSEGPVLAGDKLLVLGDLDSLEVEVDVLSADAVRLRPGMPVELERWGGDSLLNGLVKRIEPAGFTKVSALGVDEQRVWVIVELISPRAAWQHLGDGYRVEARFVQWQAEEVLQIPTSALFRQSGGWAVYLLNNGRAQLREIKPGRRSGLVTEIIEGLGAGERVILYPGQEIAAGTRVKER